MKVTFEQLKHCHVAMSIEVEEERVQRTLQSTARRISRQRPIPGFRPGHAPVGIVMRRLGKETMYNALVDHIGETLYEEALEELDIEPVAQAQLDDIQFEPLVLKFTVPVEPVVELGDYRALRLDPPVISVPDEEVKEALEELREQNVLWEQVTRPAQLGDRVTVDLEGVNSEGEVIIDEEELSLLLSLDSALPTLHEQFLDVSADEELEFDFTYPQNFSNPALAGQSLHFRAHMLEVRKRVMPTLDDEWAKTIGDYESLDDLCLALREQLEEEAGQEAEREYAGQVVETLVDQAQIDYPEEMVERTVDQMLSEQDMTLQRQGLNLDLFLSMEGKSEEQWREEQYEETETRLRRSLALSKVAEQEELEVTPVEITSYIQELSSIYGDQAQEMRRTMLASESFQESVRKDLLTEKAADRLISIAKGEVEIAKAAAEAEVPEAEQNRKTPKAGEDVEEAAQGDSSPAIETETATHQA
ncbi:MAG: trigger factor [Chloroflexota bacterium]|nr:trigger factor [Chloroflexota bacterium]